MLCVAAVLAGVGAVATAGTIQVDAQSDRIVLTRHTSSGDWPVSRRRCSEILVQDFTAVGTFSDGETTFVDTDVEAGVRYEYEIIGGGDREYVTACYRGTHPAYRGKLLLIVDETVVDGMDGKLERFKRDLVGDGWQVIRHDVSRWTNRDDWHAAWTLKDSVIIPAYNADPDNVKAVILFGGLPVPCGGYASPGGHGYGPVPTDTFYADVDGVFTDVEEREGHAGKPNNHPGDGIFDQDELPSVPELMVGRIDARSKGENEEEMLRRYLDKNHAWRHGRYHLDRRAFGNADAATRKLAQTLPGFAAFGNGKHEQLHSGSHLWFNIGTRGGTWLEGWHLTATNVDELIMGSRASPEFEDVYRGGRGANFIFAVGGSLAAMSDYYDWHLQQMIVGLPIGETVRALQNDYSDYPAEWSGDPFCMNLLGDPTIRLFIPKPPADVQVAVDASGVDLSWAASLESGLIGYNVYRADAIDDRFVRLNDDPIQDTSYTDATARNGAAVYMVRAYKLNAPIWGSYYDESQGAFARVAADDTVNTPPAAQDLVVTVDNNQPTTIMLQGSDADGDTLTYAIGQFPAYGRIIGDGNEVSYAPSDLYIPYTGPDTFTYTVHDGTASSDIATVTVTVRSEINEPPVAQDKTMIAFAAPGGRPSETIARATDTEESPLTFAITSQPSHGSAEVIAGNVLRYIPDGVHTGTDSFTYLANDGTDDSAPATVDVTVNEDVDLSSGLRGYYPFDGAVGDTTATDASGGDKHATLKNGATHDPSEGVFNGSLEINGANQVCQVPTSVIDGNGNDVTLAIWFKADDKANDDRYQVIMESGGESNGKSWNLYLRNNTLHFLCNARLISTAAIENGRWHHIALTVDYPDGWSVYNSIWQSNRITAYLDGQMLGRHEYNNTWSFENHGIGNRVGKAAYAGVQYPSTADAWFDGHIDEARYYHRKLQPAEIYAMFQAGQSGGADNTAPVIDQGATAAVSMSEDGAPTAWSAPTVSASDADGDPLTWSVAAPARHGTASVVGTGSSPTTLDYTPNPDFCGTDRFAVQVADDQGGVDEIQVTVTVEAVNDAPEAADQSIAMPGNSTRAITLVATDIELDPLTFAIVDGPAHGALAGTPPYLTYTPETDYTGEDSFTFTANDGSLDSAPATVSITVTAANHAPVAEAQDLTSNDSTPVDITLTASDADSDPLTYTIEYAPIHGVLTGTPPNVTYTPDFGYLGSDRFTFVADDGTDPSAPAAIDITLVEFNEPPVVQDLSLTAYSCHAGLASEAPALGSDSEGAALTYAIATQPQHGTAEVVAGGALRYVPDAGYTGADSFTYLAEDDVQTSTPATVSVTVQDRPDFTADLEVHWSMEYITEGLGVLDVSGGAAHTGYIVHATFAPDTGKIGQAAELTANDSHVRTYDPVFTGIQDETVTVWFKADDVHDTSRRHVLFDGYGTYQADDADPERNILAYVDDGTLYVLVNGEQSSATAIGDDTWHHFALTLRNSGLEPGGWYTAMLDGAVFGRGWYPSGFDFSASRFTLGNSYLMTYFHDEGPISEDNGFGGFLDEARIYHRILQPGEIDLLVRAPRGNADAYTAHEDAALHAVAPGVQANDLTLSGNTPTAHIVQDPGHGTVTLAPDGSFLYTPNHNYAGPDRFTYRLDDAGYQSSETDVDLTVLLPAPWLNTDVGAPDTAGWAYTEDATGHLGIESSDGTLGGSADQCHLVYRAMRGDGQIVARVVSQASTDPWARAGVTMRASLDAGARHATLALTPGHGLAVQHRAATDGDTSQTTTAGPTAPHWLKLVRAGDTLTAYASADGGDWTQVGSPVTVAMGNEVLVGMVAASNSAGERANAVFSDLAVDSAVDAVDDTYTIDEDTTLVPSAPALLGNDHGLGLTAALEAGAAHGTALVNADGSFSYVPDENYHGTDSFTYTVTDAHDDSDTATVSIIIDPVNDAPLAVDDKYYTAANTALTVNAADGVLANDSDPEGEALSVTLNFDSRGTANVNADGSFTFTPDNGFTGRAYFGYRLDDESGGWDYGYAFIYVGSGGPPVADAGPDQSLTDADGDGSEAVTLDASASHHPDGVDLESFAWYPIGESGESYSGEVVTLDLAVGVHEFQLYLTDANGLTDYDYVTITVEAVNTPPAAVDDSYATSRNTAIFAPSLGVLGNDVEPDHQLLTAHLQTNPANGNLSLYSDGSFDYVPQPGFYGADSFTYTAFDGELHSAPATVTITVDYTDADADHVPDDWEQQIIDAAPDDDIDSVDDVLPGDDFDGDGRTNFEEYAFCLDPLSGVEPNQQQTSLANDAGMPALDVTIHLRSDDANLSYTVETCTDLAAGDWTGGALTHTGGTWSSAHAPVTVVSQTEESSGVWSVTLRLPVNDTAGFLRLDAQ